VLQRYGALDRFGISLIHRHFDIADDEELMEYTDVEQRTLTVKPVKKSDIDWQHTTITNWKLTEGEEVARIGCGCASNSVATWAITAVPEAGRRHPPSGVGLSYS